LNELHRAVALDSVYGLWHADETDLLTQKCGY